MSLVTSRLLAFVLAFIIGSPTCWCCVPHEATPVSTAKKHSCCQASDNGADASGKPTKPNDNCPSCALSLTKRDLANGKIILPKTDEVTPVHFAWQAPEIMLPASTTVRVKLQRVDEDPPWRSTALYRRHCALLL